MSGDWLPWHFWTRWRMARRLSTYARRQGAAAPPADLLRRLRDDIPERPAVAPNPDAARRESRNRPRRWLIAASATAALTAALVGLNVRERLANREEALAPVPAAAPQRALAEERSPAPPAAAMSSTPGSAERKAPAATATAATPAENQIALEKSRFAAKSLASAAPPASAPKLLAVRPPSAPPPPAPPPKVEPAPAAEPSARREEARLIPPVQLAASAKPTQPPAQSARVRAQPDRDAGDMPDAAGGASEARTAGEGNLYAVAPGSTALPQAPPRAVQQLVMAPEGEQASRHKTFGIETGTGSYLAVRRALLIEGRLPPARLVRVEQLANAFEMAEAAPAVSRPDLAAEGAPLPGENGTYLLRFYVRGLAPAAGGNAIAVDFDPAVVEHWRRVGATTDRGRATALYKINLRAAAKDHGGRVLATLRLQHSAPDDGGMWQTPPWVVRCSSLSPTWQSASPALRVPGLAVQLGEALAAGRPQARLRELHQQAKALAAELPDDSRAAELLHLLARADDLATASPARPP